MSHVRAFGLFWWDFVVGDDWRAAAGVLLAIGVTASLVEAGLDAWWLMPAGRGRGTRAQPPSAASR